MMMMVMKIFIIIVMLSMMTMMIMMEIRMTMMPLMMMINMELRMMITVTIVMIMVVAGFLNSVHVFTLAPDGERQTEGTDASRKRDTRSSAGHHKSEDTSDSREDEAAVSLSFLLSFFFSVTTLEQILMRCSCLNTTYPTHMYLTKQQ